MKDATPFITSLARDGILLESHCEYSSFLWFFPGTFWGAGREGRGEHSAQPSLSYTQPSYRSWQGPQFSLSSVFVAASGAGRGGCWVHIIHFPHTHIMHFPRVLVCGSPNPTQQASRRPLAVALACLRHPFPAPLPPPRPLPLAMCLWRVPGCPHVFSQMMTT